MSMYSSIRLVRHETSGVRENLVARQQLQILGPHHSADELAGGVCPPTAGAVPGLQVLAASHLPQQQRGESDARQHPQLQRLCVASLLEDVDA